MSVKDFVNHARRPLHQDLDIKQDHFRSSLQGSVFTDVAVDLSTVAAILRWLQKELIKVQPQRK